MREPRTPTELEHLADAAGLSPERLREYLEREIDRSLGKRGSSLCAQVCVSPANRDAQGITTPVVAAMLLRRATATAARPSDCADGLCAIHGGTQRANRAAASAT